MGWIAEQGELKFMFNWNILMLLVCFSCENLLYTLKLQLRESFTVAETSGTSKTNRLFVKEEFVYILL